MVGLFNKVRNLKFILQTEAEGYLKCLKRIGSRRRFYRLSGAVLYEYASHEFQLTSQDPKEAVLTKIHSTNDARREISVIVAKKKRPLTLVAYTEEEYAVWKKALTKAVERDILEQYKIDRQLGSGCYGVVYLAENIDTCQKVAIKKIQKGSNATYLEREVNLAKSIDHPGIVRTYDVYETPDFLFLVLEYMDGGELYEYLKAEKTLSEKVASEIARTILQALAYLHRNGIVHRDLKPENILCRKGKEGELQVKIADFGLAGLIMATNTLEDQEEEDIISFASLSPHGDKNNGPFSVSSPRKGNGNKSGISPREVNGNKSILSSRFFSKLGGKHAIPKSVINLHDIEPKKTPVAEGREEEVEQRVWHDYDLYAAAEQKLLGTDQTMTSFVGSPAFAAPELLRRLRYGPPVDSWGVGVMLFNMLSGELPFCGKTVKETVKLIISGKVVLKEKDWQGISSVAKSLVKGLLQSDPLKRLSIEAALHHPFLDTKQGKISELPITNNSPFGASTRRKAVKKTVRSVKMTSRLLTLSLTMSESSTDSRGDGPPSYSDQALLDQIHHELSLTLT